MLCVVVGLLVVFFLSSRRRHTRCALVTGVQTCALPICIIPAPETAAHIMSKQTHISETPATKFLRRHRIAFEEYPYDYVDHGGAMEAARQLGLDAHEIGRASCRARVCQYV